MNEAKTIFILGGTGFVGRAVTEKYLENNWRVIIPTRAQNFKEAKNKLLLHGFNRNSLDKFIANGLLSFVCDVDLANKKWIRADNWIRLFKEAGINPSSVWRIINLVGETSKSADEILKSNLNTLESIFALVRYVKNQNKNSLFVNMGSAAEKRLGKRLSPYEYAKKAARQKIEKSNLCDFHFVAHYIKGRGEQKMKSAAPILWDKLKLSHRWLFGFKVSIIDVDDLAEIIYHLLEVVKIPPRGQKPIEVNVTNGELVFGEIVRNLLPEGKRSMPKAIIPIWFDKVFLWFYSTIIPVIKPNDQLTRRLASFAKRSLIGFKKQGSPEVFRTAEEIKKLALDADNYEVLERSPNLIVSSKHHPVIYVLRERSKEELERIVQKALASI